MITWDTEIREACDRYDLPYGLVSAIIRIESGGNPWAWNPEPHWIYFWDVHKRMPFRALRPGESANESPPTDFPTLAGDRDQEWWAQQASWGLMQVMGAVARERGFRGEYLTQLVDPRINLDYGCRQLKHFANRWLASDGWAGVISAYNQGSPRRAADGSFQNAGYVAKVRTIWT